MNLDIIDTMVRTARDAMRNAHVSGDGIVGGACVLAEDGTLYSGCTVEHVIPELSMTAETVALTKAVSDGKRSFDAIAIVADISGGYYVPDDASCKFMAQFEVPEVVLADIDGNVRVVKLSELTPYKPRRRRFDNDFYEEDYDG